MAMMLGFMLMSVICSIRFLSQPFMIRAGDITFSSRGSFAGISFLKGLKFSGGCVGLKLFTITGK
jgi:hypothetical protein